jgi:hypothetical protein
MRCNEPTAKKKGDEQGRYRQTRTEPLRYQKGCNKCLAQKTLMVSIETKLRGELLRNRF